MARRNIKIDLRLNKEEADRLNIMVERSGLSREAYLRALIKDKPIKECPPIEFFETLKALRQINNNLNQIAAKANSLGFIDRVEYSRNVQWLQTVIGSMMEAMYK